MPKDTCIALYVPLEAKIALKVTNFERSKTGETILLDCWKIYEVHFIEFREYHAQLVSTFLTLPGAMQFARDLASEIRF